MKVNNRLGWYRWLEAGLSGRDIRCVRKPSTEEKRLTWVIDDSFLCDFGADDLTILIRRRDVSDLQC